MLFLVLRLAIRKRRQTYFNKERICEFKTGLGKYIRIR
jgi:hypothetical protein